MTWEALPLGQLCEVLDSRRKPITKKHRKEGIYPYYGATGIVDYVDDYLFNEKLVLVGEDGAKWSSGDKTAFIAEGKYWVNNHAHVLKPFREVLLDEWLVYYFYFKDLREYVSGMTVPKLNQGQLKLIPIPLPPLKIQEELVERLNAIFIEIDTVKAATEANIKNFESLFHSYLSELFESTNNNWNSSALSELAKFIDYRGKTPTKTSGGIRLITAKNVKFGYLNKEPYEFIAAKDYEGWMTRGIPKKGDVLFTTEAPLANVAQLDTDDRVVFAQRLIVLQSKVEKLTNEFLKYALMSKAIQKEIISKGTGATVKGIKASLLKLIKIPYPNIKQQVEICNRLDLLKLNIEQLKTSYLSKYKNIESLKQSILRKAFNGELVKD